MALTDLRVLDLTRILGGPFCTMLLADLGADVVKIEPPGGEYIRSTPPYYESPEESYGGYFQSINRGKRSLELDLTQHDDRDIFLELADDADVIVENYRAGTMERFGLEYERLRDRNPSLIYASIRGFGDPRTGKTNRQNEPAFDLVAQALSGVMSVNGHPDDPPTKFGLGIGDIFTGVLNAVGILAAIHHRDRTGTGQYVDTAMYDSMILLCERAVYHYSYTGDIHGRHGNSHPTLFPYNAFETSNGMVVIAALSDSHWRTLCAAMDRPDLGDRYTDQLARLEHRNRLTSLIENWTSQRSTDDVLKALTPEVPCAPIQDIRDVFEDDDTRVREMLYEVEHPGADTRVEIAGQPIKMTKTQTHPRGRAPLLDEHRDEILTELHGSESEGKATAGNNTPDQVDPPAGQQEGIDG